jgi:hypothetical protein
MTWRSGGLRVPWWWQVSATAKKVSAAQEDAVNPDVLEMSVDNGIAVVTLGSANRIFLDQEMTDALTTAV